MPVSKLCVFTGFETGRCLYLWWQIKQSAEIGAVVSSYAQYSPLPLLSLKSIYSLHFIETYWCSAKQTEACKFAKIVDFSDVEKHLADILIPGLVTWTALHQSDEVLTVSRFQSYNADFLSITPSTALLIKQTQWCGNLPTGLQCMTVYMSRSLSSQNGGLGQAITASKIYLAVSY